MKEFIYDRQCNCIVNTETIYNHYIKYFSDLYTSFEEYLNCVYPNYVFIDKA